MLVMENDEVINIQEWFEKMSSVFTEPQTDGTNMHAVCPSSVSLARSDAQ